MLGDSPHFGVSPRHTIISKNIIINNGISPSAHGLRMPSAIHHNGNQSSMFNTTPKYNPIYSFNSFPEETPSNKLQYNIYNLTSNHVQMD